MHILSSYPKPSSGLLFCNVGPRPRTKGGAVAKTSITEIGGIPAHEGCGQITSRKVSILEGIFSLEKSKSTAIRGLEDNVRYLDEQIRQLHAEVTDLKEQLSCQNLSVSPSSLGLSRRKIFRVTSSVLDDLDSDDDNPLQNFQGVEETSVRLPGLKLNMNYTFGEQ